MEKGNYKTVYRLYWEYLKRSELYHDYCLWRQSWYDEKNYPPGDYDLPERFKYECEGVVFSRMVHHLYDVFRNIHSDSYEEWWEIHGENIINGGEPFKAIRKSAPVSDASGHVLEYFDNFVSSYSKKGEQPTIEEIRNMLKRRLTSDSQYIYKAICVETMETEVRISLKKDKDKREEYLNFRRSFQGGLSIKKCVPHALEKYLSIYDTYRKVGNNGEKLTMADVVLAIGNEVDVLYIRGNPNDKAVLEKYRTMYKKAQRLINNAERGNFPKYD